MERPKLKVVLVPDFVDWILGTWCREFVISHSRAIDFTVLPVTELENNPSFASSILRGADIVHCLTSSGLSRLLLFFDVRSSLPRPLLISTVHHIVEPSQVYDCLRCDSVLTVCEKYRREVAALGYPEARIGEIRNGVDVAFFSPLDSASAKERYGIPVDTPVVGFAGKATSDHDGRKGVDRFLKLIGLLDATTPIPVQVLTMGPGWEDRFKDLQFTSVSVKNLGFVDRLELPWFYNALDAYLTTARVEGGPVPVLEAMSCGTCVVSTPVGVVPEVVQPGLNGVIIPFDDDGQALAVIRNIIDGTLNRREIGDAARETAVSSFYWGYTLRNLPAFYAKATEQGKLDVPQGIGSERLSSILHERDSLRWSGEHRNLSSRSVDRRFYVQFAGGGPEGSWLLNSRRFLNASLAASGAGFSSVPGGMRTLYGTIYACQGIGFSGGAIAVSDDMRAFVQDCQDPHTGFFIGPELRVFHRPHGVSHDSEHLMMHCTSAVLPFCTSNNVAIRPLKSAHRFCELDYLKMWTESRNWKHAWFEGNNIFFVGQLLVYLRDVERHPNAAAALQFWFNWLDRTVDPETGLWGTNGYCSPMDAVYGGYHQLLVYYYEDHPLPNPKGLVDTVLSLQHEDGGFNPLGNAGACEDVDSVDILVNCYKRFDYKRATIRNALRRCLVHILDTQNPDGGFPYNRDTPQSHMGIPGTEAAPNVSCTFPTWFRIHTLALMAEIIPEHPALIGKSFHFNSALSMGWHASPPGWTLEVSRSQRLREAAVVATQPVRRSLRFARRNLGRVKRKTRSVLSRWH